jgi:hypothetical protein
VDVGAALVAGAESFEGVQPGEAALDHPAVSAQPQPPWQRWRQRARP